MNKPLVVILSVLIVAAVYMSYFYTPAQLTPEEKAEILNKTEWLYSGNNIAAKTCILEIPFGSSNARINVVREYYNDSTRASHGLHFEIQLTKSRAKVSEIINEFADEQPEANNSPEIYRGKNRDAKNNPTNFQKPPEAYEWERLTYHRIKEISKIKKWN